MGYVLILIGLIFIFIGLYILYNINARSVAILGDEKPIKEMPSAQDELLINKKKGDDFEKFVVSLFDSTYFQIKEWRGDKYVDGKYAISNHFPDLEIAFNLNSKNIQDKFAIECKFRSNYYENAINWAESYQLENYKKYAKSAGLPVFIVIGVGGQPQNPNEVFIVPLSVVETTSLDKKVLKGYKRKMPLNNFYWNTQLQLLN